MSSFNKIDKLVDTNPFNAGKLNIISILSIAFLSVVTLLARIFYVSTPSAESGYVQSAYGNQFFELIFSLWIIAITGIVLHELLGRSQVQFKYRFYVPTSKLLLLGAFAFFFGVFMQIVAWQATVGPLGYFAVERIPFTSLGVGYSSYLAKLGSAIAEEWAFAWGFLGLWLMLLKGIGFTKFRLAIALLTNATIFTLYHFAISGLQHQGEINFLPAMFLFRIALDLTFILSNYDLSVPLIGHFLTNLFAAISGNSLAQELVAQGAVIGP